MIVQSISLACSFSFDDPQSLQDMSLFLDELSVELPERPTANLAHVVSGLDRRDDIPGLKNGPQFWLFPADKLNQTAAVFGLTDCWRMCIAALRVIARPTSSLYRYFDPSEVATVKKVYTKILGPEGWLGPPEMKNGKLMVTYNRTTSLPNGRGLPRGGCMDTTNLAFLVQDTVLHNAQMVLCSQLFNTRPPYTLDDLGCNMIGNFAFQNWLSVAASVIHDFTHFDNIMLPEVGFSAIDWKGNSDFPPADGYGSYNAMNLNLWRKLGKFNADNYVWFVVRRNLGTHELTYFCKFALEAFYSIRCQKLFLPPPEKPFMQVGDSSSTNWCNYWRNV